MLRHLHELKRPTDFPAVVIEDNAPAVQIAGDLSFRAKKSKKFLMFVNFLKERVTKIRTKPLDCAQFAPKAAKLRGLESDLDFEIK